MHESPPYQQLFEASPHPYLILRPNGDFTIVAVNEKYLKATDTQRQQIVGRGLFEIFPDNPLQATNHGVADLRASLNRVLSDKHPDVMSVQQYDIPLRDDSGRFELKYWSPVNTPVLDATGNVIYIIHHVEDVTEFIMSRERGSRHNDAQPLGKIKTGAERMEADILQRAAEVKKGISTLFLERQRTREQLLESERRFQATFEQAAVGIAILSMEGRWLQVNQTLCEIVGYTSQELMSMSFKDVTYAEDLEADLDFLRQMLSGEMSTYAREKRYVRKDSSVLWVGLTVSLVQKTDHSPDYFIAIIQNIQARKETEGHLNEAKRIAHFGHWRWNLNTCEHSWSDEIYQIYGRPLGLPPADEQEVSRYFTAESWKMLIATAEKCRHEGVAYQCDAEIIRTDGNYGWIIVRGEAVRDAEGHIVALQGTVQDITERKQAEVALQHNKEQLRLFIDYAPASLAMFDRNMRYLACSQRWRSDYALGDDEVIGVRHYDVFPDISQQWRDIHQRCLAGEVIRSDEDRFERADGTIMWLRWEVRPWLVDAAVGGIVIFTEDITPQKHAEEILQQLNLTLEQRIAERTAELKALNQSLESFVYSVSHDLKAPLRGVEGYSRLLEEDYRDRLDDEGRLFISNIRAGVTRMNELIDDLLAYSRMERRTLESNVLDVAQLIHQAVTECSASVTPDAIEIIADVPSIKVQGDREGLALVIRNLLENAIKFSLHAIHPRIEFDIYQAGERVVMKIHDNGIGFDMKYSERIFEIFERLHRLEDYPGTGIGLALVKKALQRMKGRVWAQSAPGQGATFYIELPLAQVRSNDKREQKIS